MIENILYFELVELSVNLLE